jgi:hypothetical protein
MEDAWLGLGMKGYPDLPMNRGWMNSLRRLASSRTFRAFWPVLRTQHSPEFVRFCEDQLRLRADAPRLRFLDENDPSLELLGAEFAREWPHEVGRNADESLDQAGARYLRKRVASAFPLLPGQDGEPARPTTAWLILQGPIGHAPEEEPGLDFPLGLLTVTTPIGAAGADVPDPHADAELFLWIRRAYRSGRVGDCALREMMKVLSRHRESLGKKPVVRVRFPGDPDINLERDRDQWVSFFSTFDFKPASGSRATNEEDLILERTMTWT